jgi:hypothetical protein
MADDRRDGLWFPQHVGADETLAIVNGGLGTPSLTPIDFAEALDAAHEDANGELPYRVVRFPGLTRLEPNPDYQQPPRRIKVTIGPQDFELNPANVAREVERATEPAPEPEPPRRSKAHPTFEQIRARRQGLLDLLADGPAQKPAMAEAAGVTISQLADLLAKLRKEGLIRRIGDSRPVTYALSEQADRLERVDEPDAAAPRRWRVRGLDDDPGVIPPRSTRERYLDVLARVRPERLIVLLESGRVPATDRILETIEQTIFDADEIEIGDVPEPE